MEDTSETVAEDFRMGIRRERTSVHIVDRVVMQIGRDTNVCGAQDFSMAITSNQPAQFHRNRWTARPGLVAPQQSPSRAVPTDHRLRANDHQTRAQSHNRDNKAR